MVVLIFSVMMAASPVDTAGCGIYLAEDVLLSIVQPVLVGAEGSPSDLGLVAQPDTTQGFVETKDSACAPLVQYFIDNMRTFYRDVSELLAHGWTHAVMQFGDYQILLVVPRSAEGQVGSPLPGLLFFDRRGQFVSALGVQLP